MGTPGAQAATRLGRYELLARLAAGGMGEIFLARLEGAAGFEKLVVIKRILPHLADDARFRQMLITEARLASQLTHANICQVQELGETDGQLYIVMEYLEGVTLLPLLRKRSRAEDQLEFGFIGGVMQQTADALHYAHELKDRAGEPIGIVHRDVTPSNIFLTEAGVAKVLDFGIAKVKDASVQTQTGAVKGKYAYMAPEQLRGAALDRRVDVFALGTVVYEMLALRRLFQRKTDYLTFRAVMEQPIPDVRRYRADVPDAVASVLEKALDRDPSGRFDTARQFGSALLDALAPLGRTWTQGEISDFIRHEFAADLGKRSSQVALAVSRSAAGHRPMIPLISADDAAEANLDDDDEEFPAVESTIADPPRELRPTRPPHDARDFATDSTHTTPLPFDGESSASGLKPLGRSPAPTTGIPAPPSRSFVWPLLALAMVGIAAGALFLVWKQMQQQQPPAVVNITSSNRDDLPTTMPADTGKPEVMAVVPQDAADIADPDARVADGSGAAAPPDARKVADADGKRTGPRGDRAYTIAIQAEKPRVTKCAQTHGAPPGPMQVEIIISTAGRAKMVTLQPASINGTPLGACIKNVLSAISFPTAPDEKRLSVKLSASG